MSDTIEDIIGGFGLFQLFILILVSSSTLFLGTHMMIIIFLAPKITYYCNGDKSLNNTCPCDHPTYDRSVFKNTITMEWNLICDRYLFNNLTQALFHFGSLIGTLVFGLLSDSYGRRYTLATAALIQFITSLASSGIKNYYIFIVVRFILGFGIGGTMIVSYVYVMEIIGSHHRETLGVLHQTSFWIGHIMLPVFAYYIREFRQLIFWTSIAQCCMLFYIFLPESPRWLIAVNRIEKAILLLTTIAELNAKSTENLSTLVENYQLGLGEFEELKKRHARDLLHVTHLRNYTIAMSYLWFSCSFCYYGAAQCIGYVPGNIFISVGVSAVSSLVSGFSSIYLLKSYGRKTMISVLNFSAFSCFVMLTFMQDYGQLIFATLGLCANCVIFILLYIFTVELFPTVVRNTALGITNMAARTGAIIAPFVVDFYLIGSWIPPIVFCIPPLIAGFIALLLPETKGLVLATTIKETESVIIKDKIKHSKKFFIEDQDDYDTLF